jgi:FKBP-type peptidyl-prolyl cis-trans isomerase
MRVGGYRKVRISPHLAYGDRGVPGKIPPRAVWDCELWLVSVHK